MFLNNLCSDTDCLAARCCQHMGPRGQHCYFEVEKALCEYLNLQWKQDYTVKYLLNEIRFRVTGTEELPEELPLTLRSTDDMVRDLEDKLKVVK